MPKYKWYKNKRTDLEREIIAKFERPRTTVEELSLDINTRHALNQIQYEIDTATQEYLGQPNTTETSMAMANAIQNLMDQYHARGIISENWGCEATDTGEVAISFNVTGTGQRISMDIELENYGVD